MSTQRKEKWEPFSGPKRKSVSKQKIQKKNIVFKSGKSFFISESDQDHMRELVSEKTG